MTRHDVPGLAAGIFLVIGHAASVIMLGSTIVEEVSAPPVHAAPFPASAPDTEPAKLGT